jgi:hypothetical protein
MLTNVTILGKSDATVALVIDLLADLNSNPSLIQVVNNLDIPVEHRFDHPRFNIEIVNEIEHTKFGEFLVHNNLRIKKSIGKSSPNFRSFSM